MYMFEKAKPSNAVCLMGQQNASFLHGAYFGFGNGYSRKITLFVHPHVFSIPSALLIMKLMSVSIHLNTSKHGFEKKLWKFWLLQKYSGALLASNIKIETTLVILKPLIWEKTHS